MALFGKKSITDADLSLQEAVIGLILCVAAADDVVLPKERERIAYILATHPPFQGRDVRPMIKRMLDFLKQGEWELFILRCCGAVPAEYRKYAFAASVDIAVLDGNLDERETQVLARVWAHLEIDDATARNIIETLVVKYGYVTPPGGDAPQ